MGTRAIIKVEGISFAKIYKHWDGYPDATLPWLEEFNANFTKARGNDPEYKFAQLLRDSVLSADTYDLDKSTSTGWGVLPYISDAGQEYEYTLKADGTVVVSAIVL